MLRKKSDVIYWGLLCPLLLFMTPFSCLKRGLESDSVDLPLASVVISNRVPENYWVRFSSVEIKLKEEGGAGRSFAAIVRKDKSPQIDNIPAASYDFELNYLNDREEKVFSTLFCSEALRQKFPTKRLLNPGKNKITLLVCSQSNGVVNQDDQAIAAGQGEADVDMIPVPHGSEPFDTVSDHSTADGGPSGSVVARNGQLRTVNGRVVNQLGQPFQLRGVSSHGLQWYGHAMNREAIKWLRDEWKASVVRAAMYTAEGGYITNRSLKNKVVEIVDAAIDLGIYVIIDWHILRDNNPNQYRAEAIAFFDEMARRYGQYPNVLYEIANEPNGGVDWGGQIKPYGAAVIPVIRKYDRNNLIIVGSANYSTGIREAASSYLAPGVRENTLLALHFYAGSNNVNDAAREIDYVMNQGVGVFVSEWGVSRSSGSGGVFRQNSEAFMDMLGSKGVGWAVWSFCDKNETSALIRGGQLANYTPSSLSESGVVIYQYLNRQQ